MADLGELRGEASRLRNKILRSVAPFDLDQLRSEIAELEAKSQEPNFWDDSDKARSTTRRMAALNSELENITALTSGSKDLLELIDLAVAEKDPSLNDQITTELAALSEKFRATQTHLQLRGTYDKHSAIISVKAGAGGVDAQDWTEILLRMYTRWGERQGYDVTLLDSSEGEEAGMKSATLRLNGPYAYGYLLGERGVHRLVRLSPFNSANLRHTSFALVEVLPEVEDIPEVEINPDDIKFDFFRASGHGGQNVQKNSTAVRLKHLPTNITVSVQNERSQLQNKDIAMRILYARLADLKEQERRRHMAELKGEHRSAEFGNQVRSYVMHPYQMVRDHRTDLKVADIRSVLDGNLDDFIRVYLEQGVDLSEVVKPTNN